MTTPLFDEVFEKVRKQLAGLRALALVSLDGTIVEQAIIDPEVSAEGLLELATLLRIAQHTSEDTATGRLTETSWTGDQALVLARRVSAETFLFLVGEPVLRIGFARYLLRRAARELRPQFENPSAAS